MKNDSQAEIEPLHQEITTLKTALAAVTAQVQALNMLAQALVILHPEPTALLMVFEHAIPEATTLALPPDLSEAECTALAYEREWILRLLRNRG